MSQPIPSWFIFWLNYHTNVRLYRVFQDICAEIQAFSDWLVLSENIYINGGSWSEPLRSYIVIFKFQQTLFSVCLYYWSFWEENISWYAVRIYLMPAFSPDTQIYSFVPKDRNRGMSNLLKWVAGMSILHDQSNKFHRTDSNALCFYRNEVDCCRISFCMNAVPCNKLNITCGK
jgi:hypothetical protein